MKKRVSILAGLVVLAVGGAALAAEDAKKPMEMPKPTPEHKKLELFVGDWTSEGDMKASPFGPGGRVTSKDSCKWFDGGFSVVCHGSGNGPKGAMKSLGILSYSADAKAYTYYGIDNTAMTMMSVPKGTVQGDTWTYTGEDTIEGKTMKSRYTIKILSPTSYTFKFDMEGEPGSWNTVMEGKSTKAK